jgi:uncharacterized protein
VLDLDQLIAIDFHTHAEEPCGLHADDRYDDLQRAMAAYFKAPFSHPPTIPETQRTIARRTSAA